jgi:hypothetical protein
LWLKVDAAAEKKRNVDEIDEQEAPCKGSKGGSIILLPAFYLEGAISTAVLPLPQPPAVVDTCVQAKYPHAQHETISASR